MDDRNADRERNAPSVTTTTITKKRHDRSAALGSWRLGPADIRSALRSTRTDLSALRSTRTDLSALRGTRADDSMFASRQLAGLQALMAIAQPETTVVPFSGASVHMRYTGQFQEIDREESRPSGRDQEPASKTGRLASLLSFARSDKMLRNSLYLVLNSGMQAALGFAFWIITARFFSTASVGKASSLISATTLIAFLGLLGLNTAFVRYLPTAEQRNKLITAGIVLVVCCSGVVSVGYVFLIPFISHSISFVSHNIPLAVGFVLLTIGAGVNLLTDSVFIAASRSNYNAFADGVVGGVTKIVLVLLLAGGGAYGIFGAATGGLVAAALASLVLMARVLRWRPRFGNFGEVLGPILRFSSVNYLGNVFNLLPVMVVPLIVIDRIGASGAAYYYVSYQLASLLYSASYSVEQAFLAEGAHGGTISRAVLIRSARILLAMCIPAFILVILFGHEVLAAFGPNYGRYAESCLIPLTTAVLPVAAYNWFMTVLRLANKLKAIVWGNVAYAVGIIGTAWVLAPHGIGAVALSWPIGSAVGALVSGVAAVGVLRRLGSGKPRAKHSHQSNVVRPA